MIELKKTVTEYIFRQTVRTLGKLAFMFLSLAFVIFYFLSFDWYIDIIRFVAKIGGIGKQGRTGTSAGILNYLHEISFFKPAFDHIINF